MHLTPLAARQGCPIAVPLCAHTWADQCPLYIYSASKVYSKVELKCVQWCVHAVRKELCESTAAIGAGVADVGGGTPAAAR